MSTATTRRDRDNQRVLAGLGVTLLATVALLAFGMRLARSHYVGAIEGARQVRAAEQRAACLERGTLFVQKTSGTLPMVDPLADDWLEAPAIELPLQKQTISAPMLQTATVDSVRVQGLTDGEHIAWRVSWRDDSVDANVDSGRFSDAVALQFPITRNAAFTMGEEGQLVQILHWKALWQKDVDEHFQDVPDLHPNYWADLYWFAEQGRPYTVPASFKDPTSHQWFVAYSAGNPMADIYRALPVEELAAEGYGSLTAQTESVTVGSGTWDEGEWSVVFARPLQSTDPFDYQFWRGTRGSIGVAVWDGRGENVGGRKHWTNWLEFEVSL